MDTPYIVAIISARDSSGYAHLSYTPLDHREPIHSTSLYAWSDGLVTWTATRD